MKLDSIAGKKHYYEHAIETRPLKAIESVFMHLLPVSKKLTLAKNVYYKLNEEADGPGVLLLEYGIISACNAETNLFVSTLFSSSIIGIVDAYSLYYDVPGRPKHHLYMETNTILRFVTLDDFVKVMDQENLWHDIARITTHRLMTLSSRSQYLIRADSYQSIRTLLHEVWLYPEEYRTQINIPHYIQRRTNISRSRIMKILSDLKAGGYIDITNGKLITLSRLPTEY